MKYLTLAALFLAALLLASCRKAPSDPAVSELDSRNGLSPQQLDPIAQRANIFPNGTQLSIALLSDSTARFYGLIREKDTLRYRDNSERVFEIGSLSKVFTSALLAEFAVQGKLHLNQPIQEQLDIPLHNDIGITFEQLANHTAGLPRVPPGVFWSSLIHPQNPYKNFDEGRMVQYLTEKMKAKEEPGTAYQYSNLGAGILGFVLCRMENKGYEALLQEYIAQPLGMANTTTDREKVLDKLVMGLNKQGEPTSNWDLAALPGAGGILSNAVDLVKFALANFDPDNKAYALQQQPTFTIDEQIDMALGWHILKDKAETPWHWHNGGTGGYRSSMVLDLANKKGVILLSNVSAGHPQARNIDELSYALLKSW